MRAGAQICLLAAVLAVAGCGGSIQNSGAATPTPAPVPTPTPVPSPLPAIDHVVLVVLENHSFSDVIGSPFMPYFNSLASQHSLAANYFADTHPSLPNYFVLTTGLQETNVDNFTGTVSDDNVVRALTAAGKSWRAYMESIPSAGYTGGDVLPYLKQHDPFVFLQDVLNSAQESANVVPFSQMASDLASGSLPNYSFVVPNAVDDAHDCAGQAPSCPDSGKLQQTDNWLKTNIDPLINSPAFANGVLIITWDEGNANDTANGGGQVATVLVGAHVKTGFQSITFFQHESTLRLMMDLLQVADHPGGSASAPSMGEFFQ